MQQVANAYAKVAHSTLSPRELESSLLLKAATKIQSAKDRWPEGEKDLDEALTYNRRLWTVLISSVTREDNPLPREIKQNIINLGVFIFNHTLSLLTNPQPQRLGVLVNINREIAAGLRGRSADPAPEGAPSAA